MRVVVQLLVAAVIGFALAGCGNNDDQPKTGPVTVNETGEQVVPEPAETGTSTASG